MPKNLIISFARNARGFLLANWLYSKGIINCYGNPIVPSFNLTREDTNHGLVPFYNDVLFGWGTPEEKEIFTQLHNQLITVGSSVDVIKELFAKSKRLPVLTTNKKYNLILTHLSGYVSLKKLADILDAKVIRITFKDTAQADETYYRRPLDVPSPDAYDYARDDYYRFVVKYDFCINVELDNLLDLDLDFLLGELA